MYSISLYGNSNSRKSEGKDVWMNMKHEVTSSCQLCLQSKDDVLVLKHKQIHEDGKWSCSLKNRLASHVINCFLKCPQFKRVGCSGRSCPRSTSTKSSLDFSMSWFFRTWVKNVILVWAFVGKGIETDVKMSHF